MVNLACTLLGLVFSDFIQLSYSDAKSLGEVFLIFQEQVKLLKRVVVRPKGGNGDAATVEAAAPEVGARTRAGSEAEAEVAKMK